jgi:solute carrier family 45 protein 1/2/4
VLFFTTVWVSEIYKSQPGVDLESPTLASDAVRAGARSLFFQSLVNIACSIGIPFLVAESGVQAEDAAGTYRTVNGETAEPPRSALWKRAQEDIASGGWIVKSFGWVKSVVGRIRDGEQIVALPIKGLTVIKVWWISQFVFAGTMAATWLVSAFVCNHALISGL